MENLVLVPFDGSPAAVEALRSACGSARLDAGAVVSLYVAKVPRNFPLSAQLPWLAQEAERLRVLSDQIAREERATVWPEWVCARDAARAIVDVAEELNVKQIVLGVERGSRFLVSLTPRSALARVMMTAPCPVVLRSLPIADAARTTMTPRVAI